MSPEDVCTRSDLKMQLGGTTARLSVTPATQLYKCAVAENALALINEAIQENGKVPKLATYNEILHRLLKY